MNLVADPAASPPTGRKNPHPEVGVFGWLAQAERAFAVALRRCSRVLYQTTRAETT